MPVSPSRAIEYIENKTFQHHRTIIKCEMFSHIRSYIRSLYESLSSADFDRADEIKIYLLKLLSSPSNIDSNFLIECGLSDAQGVSQLYGKDIATTIQALRINLDEVDKIENPIKAELARFFKENPIRCTLSAVKIWCHKNENELYRDVLEQAGLDYEKSFINSEAQYKESDIFDVLIKVGPLRSFGWSKTPKLLVLSPKYESLYQIMWDGSRNENGFFEFGGLSVNQKSLFDVKNEVNVTIPILPRAAFIGAGEEDDFEFFLRIKPAINYSNRVVLVQINDEDGVFLLPRKKLHSFKRSPLSKVRFTEKSADEIEDGEFIIIHNADADFGTAEINIDNYPLAKIWKSSLKQAYVRRESLIARMINSGIEMQDYDRAIKAWIDPTGTVIHAPLKESYFKLLISKVLMPPEFDTSSQKGVSIKKAWSEIQHSRVKASLNGRIENEIVDEQVISELKKNGMLINDLSSGGNYFSFGMPPESGLTGSVSFYPVVSVSDNFTAPDEMLGAISKLSTLEKYRSTNRDAL